MSRPVEIWLVRHGETTANAANVLSGWSDVLLTPRGEDQARALKPFLAEQRFDTVWSSDLRRAIATAELAFGVPPQTDTRLREMCFGEIEALSWSAIDPAVRKGILDFVTFRAPGGEDLAEFKARVIGFANRLEPGRHLIFTHGGAIRALTMDLGEDRFISNGGVCVLDWTRREVRFVKEP
jgi:2,3-bisphosphoglycerate-dependent phosphoglycerate mutase